MKKIENRRFRKALVTGLLLLIVSVVPGFALSVSSYSTGTDGVTFTLNAGLMKVQVCQGDIVHVTYTDQASFPSKKQLVVIRTWPTPSFNASESGDTVTLQTSRLKIKVSKTTANVTYADLSNNRIVSETRKAVTPSKIANLINTDSIITAFTSPKDEGLYGLGQHMFQDGGGTPYNNYKGISSVTLAQEYGNPSNTYFNAVPVLVSTRGYGIYWDNYSRSYFYGADSSSTQYRYASVAGDQVDYYFFYGPSMDSVIAKYRTTTGTVPLFPKWAYGLIMSKDHYASQSEMLAVKTGYRSNKIPIDCIVQDWQYWSNSSDNSLQGCNCFMSTYTDVKAMVDSIHAANIHTMISVWAEVGTNAAQYSTLNSMGALWPSSGNDHFLDPYDSAGRELFWNNMREDLFKKHGWDSWWMDNDEPFAYPYSYGTRDTVTTKMGRNCFYYNTFPVNMTRMGYNNWRRDIPGKRFLVLHRCTFAGEQAHASVTWNNDIRANFTVLTNSVVAGLGATITGIPYWTTDIGGYWGASNPGIDYTADSARELMTRWLEYGAFTPVFRIHGNVKSGQGKELYSTTWDSTTKANLLMIDKLRYRLMPYVYSLAWMTTNSNYTPMRHLVMDFTTDSTVKTIGSQFMYGPAFLVAPVTTKGATSRSVYLPAAKWYDFWTGDAFTGPQTTTINAPRNRIPLLMRAGSIVPMGPEIQYATERADTIELRVYPGATGSFTLYEDEADGYNYESGAYATIPMTFDGSALTIGARSGTFTGMLQNRVFTIVYVGPNHGVGPAKTQDPDCVINYSGASVTACRTGVSHGAAVMPPAMHTDFQFKTAADHIVLDPSAAGRMKTVQVYDLGGRVVAGKSLRKNSFALSREFGLGQGTYIVKVKVLR